MAYAFSMRLGHNSPSCEETENSGSAEPGEHGSRSSTTRSCHWPFL